MDAILIHDEHSAALATKIADVVGLPVEPLNIRHFPDGESLVRVPESVRRRKAILVSSMDRPDTKIFPLLLAASACRDLEAKSVIWLAPYLPYMRQDKAFEPGQAVAARTFAKLVSRHVDRLITIDPHLHRIHELEEIYSIPTETLSTMPLVARYIREEVPNPILIGPDEESKQWVSQVAALEDLDFIVFKKRRLSDTSVRVLWKVPEDIQNRTVVIVDDIVSSGGTMLEVIQELTHTGCRNIACVLVHPIFAAQSYESIREAGVELIASCNTLPHESNRIDVAPLLSRCLNQVLGHDETA